jgi:hypothetical protein
MLKFKPCHSRFYGNAKICGGDNIAVIRLIFDDGSTADSCLVCEQKIITAKANAAQPAQLIDRILLSSILKLTIR